MRKFLALIIVIMMATALLVACGDSTAEEQGAQNGIEDSEGTAPPVEEAVREYEPNVLTGLKEDGEYPQSTRFAAYMVNNISNTNVQNARPQWGIGSADVLVEIQVEGGITRFMALFSDYTETPQIGPIRSARDQFFQLILPFQAFYIHEGESGVQEQFRKTYEYDELDINLGSYYLMRDQTRANTGVAIEHTAYTNAEQVQEIIDLDSRSTERVYNSTIFNFVHYDDPARELTGDANGANSAAHEIEIHHSQTYRTYFEYDEASGEYLMSQYSPRLGDIHTTIDASTEQQLSFENVLVLFTEIQIAPGHEAAGLQHVDYSYGSVGYYFSNGQAEEVRWGKGGPTNVLVIQDKFGNGTDIQLNPGKTYLSVVDFDYAPSFAYFPSGADTAEAADATAEGTEATEETQSAE